MLERADVVSARVQRKCEEFTVAVDAMEAENGRVIDLVNEQEHGGDGLFESVQRLTKGGRGGLVELERVAEALGRVDVARVAEVLVRGLERRARG